MHTHTCGAQYAHTHTPAHTHACTHTHTCLNVIIPHAQIPSGETKTNPCSSKPRVTTRDLQVFVISVPQTRFPPKHSKWVIPLEHLGCRPTHGRTKDAFRTLPSSQQPVHLCHAPWRCRRAPAQQPSPRQGGVQSEGQPLPAAFDVRTETCIVREVVVCRYVFPVTPFSLWFPEVSV